MPFVLEIADSLGSKDDGFMMRCNYQHHSCGTTPHTILTRRGVLKASFGTVLGTLLGPTLPSVFASGTTRPVGNDKSVIFLWLEGGPFQHESFDPKESGDEDLAFRLKSISTTADGIQFSEAMPWLAEQAHKMAVIRSMQGVEMEHNQAQYHMQTGWRSIGSIQAPAIGSIVSHELGPLPMFRAQADGLPAFISIGRAGYSAGHFGAAHKPTIVWDPSQPPENLGLPKGVSPEVLDQRLQLLEMIESGRTLDATDRYFRAGRDGARRFMQSQQRVAFDLTNETDKVRKEYGQARIGQGCLLARRLVESGVRFVQVCHHNMDQHAGHYPKHVELLNQLDQAMARLIADLDDRGMLEETVVIAAGEFGRTPTFNGNAGRDHWVDGYSVAMAGGGFAQGVAYGSTGPRGGVAENPVTIPDFMATLCTAIGIDPDKEYHDQFNRPIKLVDDGAIVREVLA